MNKLLAFGGIGTIVVGFILLIMPVSHIPLLDANRQVLAESERSGYCAGEVYAKTRGYGSEPAMVDCKASSTIDDSINHRAVQPAFCRGVIDNGLAVAQDECEAIVAEQEMWPTAKGSLTSSWNNRFPYPGGLLSVNVPQTGGESRTGDRTGNDRDEVTER